MQGDPMSFPRQPLSAGARRSLRAGARATAGALLALAGWAAAQPGQGPVAAPLVRPAIALRTPSQAALMGLARAGDRLVAVGERGAILLSDDQGAHWRQARAVPVSVTLTAVQFVDARQGWAVGHQGVVLHSEDGGEHWVRQLDGQQAAQLTLEEARAGGDARRIAEAERAVAEGSDKPLLALSFRDAQHGLVAGAFNLLLRTDDGGRHWTSQAAQLDNPKAAHLYALARQGQTLLIAGEQGLVLSSDDGGVHFQRSQTPYDGSFFTAAVEPDGAWLVAGLRGHAYRSRDGGRSWQALSEVAPVGITAVTQDTRGRLWLVNQAGEVMTPKGDHALTTRARTTAQQPGALLLLADGRALLAGWNGLTTTDALRVQP